ncbi:DUF882 domain-containing protein [Azospirillum canadense]|uniref:DUF882 domain-containing protein n=1 Tax=Azospirillum canadense TaxID=403962 RepID=UPI0022267A0E|nr:DUF882 domain-containing protein [Azospirillum canadense]MCW2237289.1 uncharacterized protein YcbK (DUF882 family) [Azospirillum canadense]
MTVAKPTSTGAGKLGRRELLRIGLAATAAGMIMAPEVSEAALRAPPRMLTLLNLHTGERVRTEYWSKGRYQREGLREINHLLRDHRTGATHPIDPKLLDLLHDLTRKVGNRGPVHVISGYRSPESNAWLRERDGSGVAQNSFHMQGKAIDLRVPGLSLRNLQRAALSLRGGGVGYYPDSDFVHVDVGPMRHWVSG